MTETRPPIYGLMAEFADASALVAAARQANQAGFRKMDAYSPFPIEELPEALGVAHTRLPLVVLLGGVLGCVGGFFMQYYSAVVDYPLNVGGRPQFSWPAFIPVTFELTVLGAALAAVFGMLAMNGLPQPYHPVFHVRNFELASRSRFFLLVTSRDAKFDLDQTRRDLESVNPRAIHEVPQ